MNQKQQDEYFRTQRESSDTIFTRSVFRRPDYWEAYQWRIFDGSQGSTVSYVPGSGWRNAYMMPIRKPQVDKFFKWWRECKIS